MCRNKTFGDLSIFFHDFNQVSNRSRLNLPCVRVVDCPSFDVAERAIVNNIVKGVVDRPNSGSTADEESYRRAKQWNTSAKVGGTIQRIKEDCDAVFKTIPKLQ